MEKSASILKVEQAIFGSWKSENEQYYFGHIPDGEPDGIVEIIYANGQNAKRIYSIKAYAHGMELHISNFHYSILGINDMAMKLAGPLPGGAEMYFKKVEDKLSYAF